MYFRWLQTWTYEENRLVTDFERHTLWICRKATYKQKSGEEFRRCTGEGSWVGFYSQLTVITLILFSPSWIQLKFFSDLLDALHETSLVSSVPFPRWQMAYGKNSPFSGCWVLLAVSRERPKTVGMGREGCSKLAGQGTRRKHVRTPGLCNSLSIDQEFGC